MSSHHILALVPKWKHKIGDSSIKEIHQYHWKETIKEKEFLGSPLNNKKDKPMPYKGSIK